MNRKEYYLLVEEWQNYLSDQDSEKSHYVLNEGIAETVKSAFEELKKRFGDLGKGLRNRSFKDSFEVVIESLAPKLTEKIREAQIDLHVKEWREGFESRDEDFAFGAGGYPASGDLEPSYDESKSEDWNAGFQYSLVYPGKTWNDELEKHAVEKGIEEWNDLVEVNVVKTSIKDMLNVINPVELVKHMYHAIQKHGLKVALPVVVAEVVMHTMPLWGSKLLGPKAAIIISQIPITEILTPVYLRHVTGEGDKEQDPGYLDRYEDKYGDVKL
jgi:hypothetical protein